MKNKELLFLMMLLLALSGCGKKPPEETLPTQTVATVPETEETVSELEYVTAEADGIPAVLKTLSRGDIVDVVERYDEKHYTVKLDIGYGLVEKNLLRLDTEQAFVPWTGYTYQNAEVYDNYRLAGQPEARLDSNTRVEVLENLGWCVLVDLEGTTGYMKREHLSEEPMENRQEDTSGDSGSKAPTSGDANTESFAGEDGGEISLKSSAQLIQLAVVTPQTGSVRGKAEVLADETQVVLGYFQRGDRIPVMRESLGDEKLTVSLDGLTAEILPEYVRTSEKSTYEPWMAESTGIVPVYDDLWMQDSPVIRLNSHTSVKVVYALEDCYLVEVNGRLGYMKKTSLEPVSAQVQKETLPAETVPGEDPKKDSTTTPTEAAKPKDETTPTNPTSPKEENTPTNPTSPKEENTPTNPTKPREENTPTNPTSPREENTPTNPTSPKEENTPTNPTKPREENTPTNPTKPEEESVPAEPSSPGEDRKPEDNTGGSNAGSGDSGNKNPEWTPPKL